MQAKSKNLPAEERKLATVEAVIDLASQQNPSDITTAAIAKHMALTQGALFRHFPTKEAVWQAVMEWVSERLLARVDRAIAENPESAGMAMYAVFMTHIEFVVAYPGVPRMLFGELQRAEDTVAKRMVRKLLSSYRQRLTTLIEKGKVEGDIAAEIDTASAAVLFIGTVQGLVMQSLLAGTPRQMLTDAPGAFAIYRRGIERRQ